MLKYRRSSIQKVLRIELINHVHITLDSWRIGSSAKLSLLHYLNMDGEGVAQELITGSGMGAAGTTKCHYNTTCSLKT